MTVEGILVDGAFGILEKLIAVIGNDISLAWGVKDELKKLKQTLEVIAAKTADAESKQVNDAAVSLWLKRLKGAVYDSDDVLDEFSYEAMHRSEKNSKVKVFFSSSNQVAFQFKMAHQIKDINKQLNQIANDMERFQFQNTSSTSTRPYEQHDKRITTSYFGDDAKIVGREKDKSKIVRMLTTMNISSSVSSQSSSVFSNQREKVSVISIVGMGGLGKTTLAQSIYKDKSVENHFMKRMWVCVSNDFDFYKILLNILESVTKSKCPDFSNIQILADTVRNELENSLYFLVLDDLWNEDFMEWDKLKSILDAGSVGSKIIVTTRSQKVALLVRGLFPPYNLDVLSEAECWSIIEKKAFSLGGASETLNMKIIGKQIAKKCGGLPLAATVFGGLMYSQNDIKYWLSIRDCNNFQTPDFQTLGIMTILQLSYDNLSPHLKKCFSYCCLFPKDWKFNRETLIQLWMAEGFLDSSNRGNQNSLEDIGVVGSHEVKILSASEMKNHVSDDSGQIRRVQFITKEEKEEEVYSDVLKYVKNLRTIFWQDEGYFYPSLLCNKRLRVIHRLSGYSLKTVSSPFKFKHLRYLDVSYTNIEDVHAASISRLYNLQTLKFNHGQNVQNVLSRIGSLKNLRHLDISSSDAKVLPDSIARLTNLMTLDISCCRNISVLPANIGCLQNLLCLDLEDTEIEVLPESCITGLYNLEIVRLGSKCKLPVEITHWHKLRRFTHARDEDEMPRGIQELTHQLQELQSYLVRKEHPSIVTNTSSGIEELASLDSLQLLEIKYLENVRGQIDAESARLKDKQYIRRLHLHWSSCRSDDDDSMVLEGLQPHRNLKELKIQRFKGLRLPKWMGLSYCLPNLVELYLFECDRCNKLPGLGMLPCLSLLHIKRMDSVKSLGKEFYHQEEGERSTSSSTAAEESSSSRITEYWLTEQKKSMIYLFPSLIELNLDGMESLKEWVPSPPPPYYSFPLLESLIIKNCRRLRTTPNSIPSPFPSVEFDYSVVSINGDQSIIIDTNDKAIRSILATSPFPSLKSLKLEDIDGKAVTSILASIKGLTLTSISIPGHQSNFTR